MGPPGGDAPLHGANADLQLDQLLFPGGIYYGAYANCTAWSKVINSFCCPSDSQVAFGGALLGTPAAVKANGSGAFQPNTNSYKGSIGTTTSKWGTGSGGGQGYAGCTPDPFGLNPIGKGNGTSMTCWPDSTGMFVLWLAYGIKDCTDGTSNTIIFTESLVEHRIAIPTP